MVLEKEAFWALYPCSCSVRQVKWSLINDKRYTPRFHVSHSLSNTPLLEDDDCTRASQKDYTIENECVTKYAPDLFADQPRLTHILILYPFPQEQLAQKRVKRLFLAS